MNGMNGWMGMMDKPIHGKRMLLTSEVQTEICSVKGFRSMPYLLKLFLQSGG